jgi:hypothetical protein
MAQVALIPKFLTSDVHYERKQLLIRLIQVTTPATVPMLPVKRNTRKFSILSEFAARMHNSRLSKCTCTPL